MTDTEYFKKLISLSDELKRTGNASPYDPNAYNAIVDKLNNLPPRYARGDPRNLDRVKAFINSLTYKPIRSRRRRPSLMFYIICFLIIMFGIVIWGIIRPL